MFMNIEVVAYIEALNGIEAEVEALKEVEVAIEMTAERMSSKKCRVSTKTG